MAKKKIDNVKEEEVVEKPAKVAKKVKELK